MSVKNSPPGRTGGKVAIVTGGGSGIGLAIAEKFTQAGIETIIVGRDMARRATELAPVRPLASLR